MKYTITINQARVVEAGYGDGKTDLADWAIIDYIQAWQSDPKAVKRGSWALINCQHLADNMPLLGINSRQAVGRRIQKLADLGLLDIEHGVGGRVFACLSAACHGAINERWRDGE